MFVFIHVFLFVCMYVLVYLSTIMGAKRGHWTHEKGVSGRFELRSKCWSSLEEQADILHTSSQSHLSSLGKAFYYCPISLFVKGLLKLLGSSWIFFCGFHFF